MAESSAANEDNKSMRIFLRDFRKRGTGGRGCMVRCQRVHLCTIFVYGRLTVSFVPAINIKTTAPTPEYHAFTNMHF